MHINPTIAHPTRLTAINHLLTAASLNLPLEGEGTYRKLTGRYGHIKITISENNVPDGTRSVCNWMVDETVIPTYYREAIEKTLAFFITYIAALRGEEVMFRFDVTGGSYHPVDSTTFSYEMATINCLINAFHSSLHQPSPNPLFVR